MLIHLCSILFSKVYYREAGVMHVQNGYISLEVSAKSFAQEGVLE